MESLRHRQAAQPAVQERGIWQNSWLGDFETSIQVTASHRADRLPQEPLGDQPCGYLHLGEQSFLFGGTDRKVVDIKHLEKGPTSATQRRKVDAEEHKN